MKNNYCVWICLFAAIGAVSPKLAVAALSQRGANQVASRNSRVVSNVARNSGNRSLARGRDNFKKGKGKSDRQARLRRLLGVLQIAEGLKGLAASARAGKLADQADHHAESLGDQAAAPGLSSGMPNQAKGGSGQSRSHEDAIFGDPEVIDALADVEEEFGVPGDEFARGVLAGGDAMEMLKNSDDNPLDELDVKEPRGQVRAEAEQDNRELLAQEGGLANAPEAGAASIPAASAVAEAKPSAEVAKSAYAKSVKDRMRERLGRKLASEEASTKVMAEEVGPLSAAAAASEELQAEMAAREAEARKELIDGPTIFQQIKRKYLEKFQALSDRGGIRGQ